jgi:hypothetical protein
MLAHYFTKKTTQAAHSRIKALMSIVRMEAVCWAASCGILCEYTMYLFDSTAGAPLCCHRNNWWREDAWQLQHKHNAWSSDIKVILAGLVDFLQGVIDAGIGDVHPLSSAFASFVHCKGLILQNIEMTSMFNDPLHGCNGIKLNIQKALGKRFLFVVL